MTGEPKQRQAGDSKHRAKEQGLAVSPPTRPGEHYQAKQDENPDLLGFGDVLPHPPQRHDQAGPAISLRQLKQRSANPRIRLRVALEPFYRAKSKDSQSGN